MKKDRMTVMAALLIMFISVQVLGMATGYRYLNLISVGAVEPALGQPENPMNALYLLGYILVVTLIILLVIKFKKSVITVLEGLAIFFASMIVFQLLVPISIPIPYLGLFPLGILLALLLTYVHLKKRTYLTQNIALVFAVSGAGAVLGASLGVLPVLLFILALGVYDFISVFYTKHMLYLAKAITEKPRAFTAALPSNIKSYGQGSKEREQEQRKMKKSSQGKEGHGHTFQLGGGDLAIPLMFTVSTMRVGLMHSLATAIGALVALIILFSYVIRKPGIALPALPPITAGGLIGFLISVIVI